MGSWVWPVELQTKTSLRVWVGRILHWTLTLIALAVVGVGIMLSGLQLQLESEFANSLAIDPVTLSAVSGALAFGAFFTGRSLRLLVARE
jgi:hypothetical protein